MKKIFFALLLIVPFLSNGQQLGPTAWFPAVNVVLNPSTHSLYTPTGIPKQFYAYTDSATAVSRYATTPNSPIVILASSSTTLVAGTKTVTVTGATSGSHGYVTYTTPSGTTLTTGYQITCTTNSCTIQANVAAGTINTSDVSTVNYFVTN